MVRYKRDDLIPVYLRNPNIRTGGQLKVTPEQLESAGVDLNKTFTLSFHNVREFDGLNSDNFQLRTRVKCDSVGNYACPQFSITILCEEHIFYVPLTTLGCVGNIGVKFGEVVHEGDNSDLSNFGREIYNWQELLITVENKHAQVFVEGDEIYKSSYSKDFGQIMGLIFRFSGTGSVDFVEVMDVDSKIVFKDSFM